MGYLCCRLELLAGSDFLERRRREVRRIPGSVTEPIHKRNCPLTKLADNARRAPRRSRGSPSACTTRRGASFARYQPFEKLAMPRSHGASKLWKFSGTITDLSADI